MANNRIGPPQTMEQWYADNADVVSQDMTPEQARANLASEFPRKLTESSGPVQGAPVAPAPAPAPVVTQSLAGQEGVDSETPPEVQPQGKKSTLDMLMDAETVATSLYGSEEDLRAKSPVPSGRDVRVNLPLTPKWLGGLRARFTLSGSGLDAASRAVAEQMKGQGGPKGFAQSVIGGYAGSRMNQLAEAKKAYEEDQKEREAKLKERRAFMQQAALSAYREGIKYDPVKANYAYVDLNGFGTEEKARVIARLQKEKKIIPPSGMIPVDWLKGEDDRLTANTRGTIGAAMQQRYDNNEAVKRYNRISEYINEMRNLRALPPSNSTDNLIVRLLAKVADDRTGVREEEFRSYFNAQSLRHKAESLLPSLKGEGVFADAFRNSLFDAIEAMQRGSAESAQKVYDMFAMRYRNLGLDPVMFLGEGWVEKKTPSSGRNPDTFPDILKNL